MNSVHGSHCVYSLHYHLVLVTRYRHPCITPEVAVRMDEITKAIIEKNKGELLEANGEPDHRHFLLTCPPAVCLSVLVGAIKTATSRVLRREFASHLRPFYWKPVFWSRSYCLVSAGGAPLEIIKSYIQDQGSGA